MAVLCVIGVGVLIGVGVNAYMVLTTRGDATSTPSKLPHAQIA